jgi:hypothetical protein
LTFLSSTNGDAAEEDKFFKEHPIYNKDVLNGLETLFHQYVMSDDPSKLARVRVENIHAFHALAVLCLRHTVGAMTWKFKHRKSKISEFLTVSDETLALLILENNARLWRDKAYGISSNNSIPKYMMVTKGGKARKEWSKEGKTRFNSVFAQLKDLRSFPVSKSNEMDLFKHWNRTGRVSGNNGREDSLGDGDDNDSVGDEEVIVVYEA